MKTMNILCTLLCTMLLAAMPATAQNTNDDKNKAIIETNEGSQELNTDDIQLIRFDGGKVTVVQPSGETTFDRTLRSLSFHRPNPGTLRLTATTSIGTEGGNNRAQAIDGDGKLKATWAEGDQVYVYADASSTSSIGTLTPKNYGEKSATLTGNINADGLSNSQTLYFSTKDRATLDLSTQDGRVENLFYFTATGTITIDGANASVSNLRFTRPIAIVKFTLKDKGNSDAAISAKSFTVHDGTNTYVVTPASAKNELFVGIPSISSKTITLTATDGNDYYLYQRTGVTFANNEYYGINVKMQASDLARPLTFEAKTAGAQVTFTAATSISPAPSIEYSLNGGAWTAYDAPVTLTNAGDKVSFRGNNATYATHDRNSKFSCDDDCYLYGNIMSLVSKENYATATNLTENYAFFSLFSGNDKIYSHSSNDLVLPATTLTNDCYNSMFAGCTSLTTAPALPATTLASSCYAFMFFGCEKLNSVTCLATDISATDCTENWLLGVASTGTFYKAALADWSEKTGADGIPEGWTVLPVGALKGQFTINAGGGKVYFSQGNLQYQANSTGAASAPYTGVWRFAPNQYDMIGSDNANISDSYTGWIDLLGWGTGDAPTKATQNSSDYSTFTDWGVNAISNGGNTANMWSSLTKDEWVYIFEHHTKGWSTVNGVNGYVIRPDGISTAVASSYTASEWAVEEAAGSVFLPAACSRGGTTFNAGSWGDYWSSTPYDSADAYYQYFHQGGQNPSRACRWGGRSVRLVYEPPYFQGAGTEADPYLISSEDDWNYLAIKVNSGTSYAGKFFRQTADIDVTTMVGVSDSWSFSGTYDGDGKTLNLSLNTTSSCTAPFQYIVDATIKNVVTTGTVYSTSNHPSGLVGFTDGNCTIQNCRVSANVGGAQHSGGIVGHCHHANISIIGCVYSGTLTPASGQWTGGIIGWGGDDGGHTISISDCLFAGNFVYSTNSTKFHPIGILQNQSNTKYLSNTYYTLGAQNTTDDASFVKGLDYKGKFARSITAGTDVTAVANAGASTVYDVSGITSYGTGILYAGVLYAGNGEAISLTLSHADAPAGFVFSQYTVTGGGSLANPTSNSPTLTMTDANQTINAQWSELITYTAPTLRTGLTFNGNHSNVAGSAQNLVNAGTVTHGTIYYSTDGGSSWSTSVPQGTNAGSYTVHYKVEPDAGYSGGIGSTLLGSTTIAKANGWCTLSPTSSSGWGSISKFDVKIASFTVTHHGGGLSYVKGGSQQDNISVGPNGNSYTLTCTSANKISSAVTITVTSAATTNYKAASATYTCNP